MNARVTVIPSGADPEAAVEETFDNFGGLESLLAGRQKALVKINAIDCRPEVYTSPAVLGAVLSVLRKHGVTDIGVIENCTQGNFTRLVFAATELGRVCRRHGARPVFLDEGPVEKAVLPGLASEVRFPRAVMRELTDDRRRGVFFLNLPKLKTHSMTVVTLGVKNLLGLMDQRDRMHEHNYNLHARLAALGVLFQPDFTLIDGSTAVFHGHYPPASVVHRCIDPLGILIGGQDMLAVDTVGARILGYSIEEVEHLRLSGKTGSGCSDLDKIEVTGDLSAYTKKYPYSLLPEMPPDVEIIRGEERCCAEGCDNNTRAVLQFLYLDQDGKGGFTILMGKGFNRTILEELRGPLLLAGQCAVDEAGEYLARRLKRKQIYSSPSCNDLASTIRALTRLMKVNPFKLVPLPALQSFRLLVTARLKGSRARVAL